MNIVKSCFSTLSTVFIYLMGGYDKALLWLLIIMGLDYFTGILKAIKKKKLNSEVGRKGIVKKVGYLCLVSLSVVVDEITGNSGIIRNLTIYYIIANEGLSILENFSELGIYVPNVIKEKLEQLKEENPKERN